MEYKSVNELALLARVDAAPVASMSQAERLARWAELLEQHPAHPLNTFFQTEYRAPIARDAMRVDDSPLSIAFADPVLRGEGLASDSYGDAKRFFSLSDAQLHQVLCYCHHGATLSAGTAAQAVRGVLASGTSNGVMTRIRRIFA